MSKVLMTKSAVCSTLRRVTPMSPYSFSSSFLSGQYCSHLRYKHHIRRTYPSCLTSTTPTSATYTIQSPPPILSVTHDHASYTSISITSFYWRPVVGVLRKAFKSRWAVKVLRSSRTLHFKGFKMNQDLWTYILQLYLPMWNLHYILKS